MKFMLKTICSKRNSTVSENSKNDVTLTKHGIIFNFPTSTKFGDLSEWILDD